MPVPISMTVSADAKRSRPDNQYENDVAFLSKTFILIEGEDATEVIRDTYKELHAECEHLIAIVQGSVFQAADSIDGGHAEHEKQIAPPGKQGDKVLDSEVDKYGCLIQLVKALPHECPVCREQRDVSVALKKSLDSYQKDKRGTLFYCPSYKKGESAHYKAVVKKGV